MIKDTQQGKKGKGRRVALFQGQIARTEVVEVCCVADAI